MSTVAQTQAVIEVATATHPTPVEVVAAALDGPAIKDAIRRGVRKAQIRKYTAVTKSGRDGVCEYTSDFEQATYLALLEGHAERFAELAPEERAQFVEKLAKSIAWKQVYRRKLELPLAEHFYGDQNATEGAGPQVFTCDDISLNGKRRHPDCISARAFESSLIERIDRQRTETLPREQPETLFERACRLLGVQNADWMFDYENRRYTSARTPADRVRYYRLRKKLDKV